MNLCIDHSNVNIDDLYFIKPVKNKIRKNSLFYKLFYDKTDYVINNFIIKYTIFVDLHNNIIHNEENKRIFDSLMLFENNLHEKLMCQNKLSRSNQKPLHTITSAIMNTPPDKIRNGTKRKSYLSMDHYVKMLNIRINGIWEDETNYGYSFTYCIV
tara:strand:+ start:1687 stop:2154 length:468 start_codon:yes stop_codon:yes gene_type:complete